MTGESARHWIYVSGDLDIERLAGDNDGMRAVSREVGICLKWKPLGVNLLTTAHLAFACFQCDFLGEHNVSD